MLRKRSILLGALIVSVFGCLMSPSVQALLPNDDAGQTQTLIGRIAGRTYAVEVQGRYAYVGAAERLMVVDVSTPTRPVVVGTSGPLTDAIRDIHLVDDLAVVAAGEAGLAVFNVAEPTNPVAIGHYDTPGTATGIHVVNSYAYLADGWAGMLVLDLGNPADPVPVAVSESPGTDWDVFVSGGYAYVASDEDGVRVVDVSDPVLPVTIGSIQTPNDANGVFVDGGLAYIAAGSAGLRILDISDPSVPREVGAESSGYARRVHVSSRVAYIAAERQGVLMVDVIDPTQPKRLEQFAPEGSANGVDVSGNHLYVADGVGGLIILSVSQDNASVQTRNFLSTSAVGSSP